MNKILLELKNNKRAILMSIAIYLAVHGYRLVNLLFSHDSLMIYQCDTEWQISLGRFMQPLLALLRGGLCSPFLIMELACAWMTIAILIIFKLFHIKELKYQILTAAILICNTTVGLSNATYISWVDGYAICMCLAVLAAYLLWRKGSFLSICAAVACLIAILAIYQAYICVCFGCLMILMYMELLRNVNWKDLLSKILRIICTIGTAALVYYLLWKGICAFTDIEPSNSYNGLTNMGFSSLEEMATAIENAYTIFRNWLMYPSVAVINVDIMETFANLHIGLKLIRLMNMIIVALIVVGSIILNRKNKNHFVNTILEIAIIVVTPFVLNFTSVLSKGMCHGLMVYAFNLIYVWAIVLWMEMEISFEIDCLTKRMILIVPAFTLIWNNFIWTNQVYLEKGLQEEETLSLVTRIVNRIESTEGYVRGETPVAFVGNLCESKLLNLPDAFDSLIGAGLYKSTITYYDTLRYYLEYYIQNNIFLVDIGSDEIIENMEEFPAANSVCFDNGILVVKLAD